MANDVCFTLEYPESAVCVATRPSVFNQKMTNSMKKIDLTRRHPIQDIVAIGCLGDLFQKLGPALRQLFSEGLLTSIIHLDIKLQKHTYQENYCQCGQSGGCQTIPLDTLSELGLTNRRLLIYIAAPSRFHVPYIEQALLLPGNNIIVVEKPFALDFEKAKRIIDRKPANLVQMDHLFGKKEVQTAMNDLGSKELERSLGFEFNFIETSDVKNRDIDNVIYDLAWHGFSLIIALFRRCGYTAKLGVISVDTSTYSRGPLNQRPKNFTAAKIEGEITFAGRSVPFVIRVGKGMSRQLKQLLIWGRTGHVRTISLEESGFRPHYNMVRELITQEYPDMGIDIDDVPTVVKACSDACSMMNDHGNYSFNSIPDFLKGGSISNNEYCLLA